MSALADFQRRFRASLLCRDEQAASAAWPAKRLRIYRGNVRHNVRDALGAAFPLLLAMTGEDEFTRLAWAYQRACPPTSGNLSHVGEALPAFLAVRLAGSDEACLADIAHLEWAIQEVLSAGDATPVWDVAALASVPPARQGELRFTLHPAVRLLRTEWPVYELWRRHGEAGAETGMATCSGSTASAGLRLCPGPEWVLVRRTGDGIELRRLPAWEYAFLRALDRQSTLAAAIDAAIAVDVAADPAASVVRFAAVGIVMQTAAHSAASSG